MIQLTIDMPEGALSSLRQDPVNFVRELRLSPQRSSGTRCDGSPRDQSS